MDERFSDLVELVYLDAPNPASGAIPRDVAPYFPEGPYFEWFTAEEMGDRWEYDEAKLKRSLQAVATALKERGPFDGIVGFSQGTALSSTIVALQQYSLRQRQDESGSTQGGGSGGGGLLSGCTELLRGVPPLKFCILFAGFQPRDPAHTYLWDKKLPVPSLHIYGDRDALRPECKKLSDAFENSTVIQHTRGHSIPTLTPVQVAVVRAFLQTFLDGEGADIHAASNGNTAVHQSAAASVVHHSSL